MWLRLREMLVKEFIQVFRDKRTRFLLFGPPVIQMVIFGYAATLDIQHVPTAIIDYENSQVSRDFISRFQGSRYFDIRERTLDRDKVRRMVDHGDALLALQINAGFTEQLRKGQTANAQVIVDASNSNTALVSLGYVNQIASKFAQEYQTEMLNRSSPGMLRQMPSIVLERQPWFNPDLRSQWFFVPGVMGNLVTLVIVLLTAFAIVREREIGTLEQIMVTPITQVEFILGKTIPFFLIGLFDAALITAVGTLWFRVPLKGSLLVLATGTVLYLFCVLGIGLLISTVSANQQQAMVSAFFFLMPAIIFSGFASPISSMPAWLQFLTLADPLRYFIVILRGIFLKGVGFDVLWPQMASLAAYSVLILLASVMRFHKSLD
ncbi:MAG TPA: ABC transporter permease [Candidatus Saccharimonadales bacterium]|nr:ABC transporter permease [Candidatus Saccharimonadales bacterium]